MDKARKELEQRVMEQMNVTKPVLISIIKRDLKHYSNQELEEKLKTYKAQKGGISNEQSQRVS